MLSDFRDKWNLKIDEKDLKGISGYYGFPTTPAHSHSGLAVQVPLGQYACEFIAARKDTRFLRSTDRPTSRLKQLWFLSRALAGALYGVGTRTAMNLVGSMRPEQMFEESREGKPRASD